MDAERMNCLIVRFSNKALVIYTVPRCYVNLNTSGKIILRSHRIYYSAIKLLM